MEIEYLREFAVIAKLGSFSRAAEELSISQSSLSKHILALEKELGVPLLNRNSRNVSVSTAGGQILPMAAQVYELQNKIKVAAARESTRTKTLLKIASIPVMAQYDITGVLARFQKKHPEVTLDVLECEQQEIEQTVMDGRCELAFTRKVRDNDELEYLPFYQDSLVAVISKEHPFAEKESIEIGELRLENLLFLDTRTGLYHLCRDLCHRNGFVPEILYTGHRPENIVELAAENMGIALLMKGHTDYIASRNVVCIPVSPAVESTICLVRTRRPGHSEWAEAFWQEISDSTGE